MAYDVTTTPAIGNATKQNDYIRLRDAIKALSAAGNHDFGGDVTAYISDTSFVDLPSGSHLEIDGTNLSGMSVFFEANAFANPSNALAGSMFLRLFNVTAGAAVASSQVEISGLSAGQHGRGISSALTLAAAANVYKVQVQSSNASFSYAGTARVTIRG